MHRQHDAGEFLHHCLLATQMPCYQCSWESRLEEPARVVTSGTLEHAIVLPFEGAPPYTLQGMLDRWSGQYAPQALVTHRGVVWLQLERYMYAAAKNRQTVRIRPGDQVAVPLSRQASASSMNPSRSQRLYTT